MNHVASMNAFEQESSFLRFGTWSVVLHVLFFVFVSFVHFSLDVEKPPPTVKVTFVETPAPPPPEPEPQAPAHAPGATDATAAHPAETGSG